jgi:hypothetical protein
MSRSGYSDDVEDNWALIMWRGAVASSIRGKRGQAFLREMLATLDAMPSKRLIPHDLEAGGEVCAIGAVGAKRGIDMTKIDPEDNETVAGTFDIAVPLVREIVYVNDDYALNETPERRWARMRNWVVRQIKTDKAD